MGLKINIMAAVLLVHAGLALAATVNDVQGIAYREQGLKVVEDKCLACHNRQRIDAAIKNKQDMEKVLKQMEKKGVVLSDKEKMVMGHFWQKSPLKPVAK
jgi:hypothetical protein